MPDYNTPGVPEPEVSATAQRAKTAALPYVTTNTEPRSYENSVQRDGENTPSQVAQGNGPQYD